MKFQMPRVLITSFLMMSTASSFAAPLCDYAAFTPDSLRYALSSRLIQSGYAVVPQSVGLDRTQNKNELYVASDSVGFGFLRSISDVQEGTSSFTVLNHSRETIAQIDEKISACPGGICRETTFALTIGKTTSTIGIALTPYHGVDYYINGEYEASSTIWYVAFDDYMQQVQKTLVDKTRGVVLARVTRAQQISVSLATDPVISPYLVFLAIEPNLRGELILKGRTSYSIYNLIMAKANAAGVVLRPQVIFDSSIILGEPLPSADLQRCVL